MMFQALSNMNHRLVFVARIEQNYEGGLHAPLKQVHSAPFSISPAWIQYLKRVFWVESKEGSVNFASMLKEEGEK